MKRFSPWVGMAITWSVEVRIGQNRWPQRRQRYGTRQIHPEWSSDGIWKQACEKREQLHECRRQKRHEFIGLTTGD